MDINTGMINSTDGQRGWLENLYENLIKNKRSKRLTEASAKISKYAELICANPNCHSPHTKEYVVNQLGGICAKCGCDDWIDIQKQKDARKHKKFECSGCGKVYSREDLKKGFVCECGSSKFVSTELLDRVIANTIEFLRDSNIYVQDMWHENGKVFASFAGRAPNGGVWKTAVVASGEFTKNDVVLFSIDENGGHTTVATVLDDPIIKLAKNEKCESYWETDDSEVESIENKISDISDSNGKKIHVGSKVEWYTKKGPMRGEVIKAFPNGSILVGMTYDQYGPAKPGTFGTTVELDQNLIKQYGVESR